MLSSHLGRVILILLVLGLLCIFWLDVDHCRCAHFAIPLLLIVTLMHKCYYVTASIYFIRPKKTFVIWSYCHCSDWIYIAAP